MVQHACLQVTEEQIDGFFDEYRGSEEEQADLLALYSRFRGNMDQASCCWVRSIQVSCSQGSSTHAKGAQSRLSPRIMLDDRPQLAERAASLVEISRALSPVKQQAWLGRQTSAFRCLTPCLAVSSCATATSTGDGVADLLGTEQRLAPFHGYHTICH